MYSRYDKMRESLITDTEDRVPYPDPLSLNFTKIILTEVPKLRTLSETDLQKFWLYTQNFYNVGNAEGDDIILTINNIPYLGMLKSGDQIYFPANTDVYSLVTEN